jgi:hypothetical protein
VGTSFAIVIVIRRIEKCIERKSVCCVVVVVISCVILQAFSMATI